MELPPELTFAILLPLSYQEIQSYCQTNVMAHRICQSDYFWETKAQMDLNHSLSLMVGQSPMDKFRILYEILHSDFPILEAIENGQMNYIYNRWGGNYLQILLNEYYDIELKEDYPEPEFIYDDFYEDVDKSFKTAIARGYAISMHDLNGLSQL